MVISNTRAFRMVFKLAWPLRCGARTAFAHTAAVWSMVGHVVGLGDRHGENILLDQESGDCVHVDFSCLFDKVGVRWCKLCYRYFERHTHTLETNCNSLLLTI